MYKRKNPIPNFSLHKLKNIIVSSKIIIWLTWQLNNEIVIQMKKNTFGIVNKIFFLH